MNKHTIDYMNKSIFLVVLLVLSIGFVSATPELQSTRLGDCRQIIHNDDKTSTNILTAITKPDGTIDNIQAQMTSLGNGSFNYTYCNNTINGWFCPNGKGNYSGSSWSYCYEVTPTGDSLSLATMIAFIFVILLVIVVFAWSLLSLLEAIHGYGIAKDEDASNEDFDKIRYKSIGWITGFSSIAYLSLWTLSFLLWYFCSSFVWMMPVVSSILWLVWKILSWLIPFYILGMVAWMIIANMTENLIKDYERRGYSREDARRMARRRR